MTEPAVLGIDPGHLKCGLAAVTAAGTVLERRVVPAEELPQALRDWLARWPIETIVVGDGTRSKPVLATAREVAGDRLVVSRDETGTTLLARDRYWRENPPRGLWRLVPTSLRVPPAPVDDLVAAILADRWWAERRTGETAAP